jgi:hypothetical protein
VSVLQESGKDNRLSTTYDCNKAESCPARKNKETCGESCTNKT